MRPAWSKLGTACLLLVLSALACNTPNPLFALATLEPSPTTWPTLAPTSTPTPAPTPMAALASEPELAEADWALYLGDWELAIRLYEQARANRPEPRLQAAAQLGLAKTYMRSQQWTQAVEQLSAYLLAFPEHSQRPQAFLMRAIAHRALDRGDLALEDYRTYLDLRPQILDAHVREQVGDLLRSLGRPLEAVAEYRAAIEAPRLGGGLAVLLKVGRSYMEASEFGAALSVFDEVHSLASDPSTRATTNYLAGKALEALGDQEAAYLRYLDSVRNYPTAYDSYIGLIELVEADIPVDEFQRGLVDYHAGAYAPGLRALDRYLETSPSASAHYYRGLTRRALGDSSGALEDFTVVIEGFPEDTLADQAWLEKARTEWAYLELPQQAIETYLSFVALKPGHGEAPGALFNAGRVAERSGDLPQAAAIWLRLPQEYPGHFLGYQGGFEAGIVLFRQGRFTAAREAFQRAIVIAQEPGQLAASELWVGKCHQAEGSLDLAREAWLRASQADPTGYYSVRAEDLSAGRAPFQIGTSIDFSIDLERERLLAEEWLRLNFPVAGSGSLSGLDERLANDLRMLRGEEYWRVGLLQEAEAELEALRQEVAQDPLATYRLLGKFLELRMYRPAILASRHILALAGMDDQESLSAPAYFNLIRFGPYFKDLIFSEAQAQGLDGLFVLAVARQESLFDPNATSYAAAHGLMQVIPSTGQGIADQLGWPPGYTSDDLYRPLVSVRFGSFYLAQQYRRFAGDLVAVLAAYNAGPGNAAIWFELAPSDPDLFLEVIRLEQPHRYIRVIYEAYAIYQRLYASGP